MGLLDKLFKSQRDIAKDEILEVNWHPLTRLEQLDEIDKESKEQPVAIFKHSTSCGISNMVLRRFESAIKKEGEGVTKLYFLDLLSNREISNAIAQKWGVRHESPQLLLIRSEKVVDHASHAAISAATVRRST